MENRKLKIIEQLLSHLEEGDAEDVRELLKPKSKDPSLEDGFNDASDTAEKGPMDELLEEKGEEAPEKPPSSPEDNEEVSDDELEELIREHLS